MPNTRSVYKAATISILEIVQSEGVTILLRWNIGKLNKFLNCQILTLSGCYPVIYCIRNDVITKISISIYMPSADLLTA